jgi:spore coat protein U-like protein
VTRARLLRAAVTAGAATIIGAYLAAPSSAATATANLGVSATVTSNCTISTAALAFGNYDPVGANLAADLDSNGTVTVACTKGSTATIGLGLGANPSGSVRRMTDGTDFLTYELYQDSNRTTVWGNAGADLLSPPAAPSKAPRNFTVYGRVVANQDVAAGNYSDTVLATVNF